MGCGTVYAVTPPVSPGGVWTEATIHSFTNSPSDGASPYAGVVASEGGVLYGATYQGGAWNEGTVYSLTHPHHQAVIGPRPWFIYSFTGGRHG